VALSVLRRVEVVPHSRGWAAEFRAEADRLAAVLGEEVVAVHHVGSTAIPGISAKPIIDILLEVREVERLDDFPPRWPRWATRPGASSASRKTVLRQIRGSPAYAPRPRLHYRQPELERHLVFRTT
jgi:GrpB-like predicted nucleotidyltransferase (UPF0157 family)